MNARDLILETASSIFSRFGFKKTTMDEIAGALHKAKSSLYYYFKSKEEIFRRIIEKESISMKEEIKESLEKESLPVDKLKAFIITRIKVLKRRSNYYNALKDEYLENYSFIEDIRKSHLDDELRTLKGILSEGTRKGIFSINNLEQTAKTILTALRGLEFPILWDKESAKIELNMDNFFHVLLNGIVKRQ